jgi:hypothetical protein
MNSDGRTFFDDAAVLVGCCKDQCGGGMRLRRHLGDAAEVQGGREAVLRGVHVEEPLIRLHDADQFHVGALENAASGSKGTAVQKAVNVAVDEADDPDAKRGRRGGLRRCGDDGREHCKG